MKVNQNNEKFIKKNYYFSLLKSNGILDETKRFSCNIEKCVEISASDLSLEKDAFISACKKML